MRILTNKINKISKLLIILTMLLIAAPVNALAMDKSIVDNTYYWNDVDNVVSANRDDLQYSLKYVFDENANCMYFYLFYFCESAREVPIENIYFGISMTNSYNDYELMIGTDGIDDRNNIGISQKFDVYCRYADNSTRRGAGKILVAVELKDSVDKKQNNKIDCFFCVNYGNRISLLNDYYFNLEPPTTTKRQTTTKQTTTKQITTKSTTKSNTTKTQGGVTTKLTTEKQTTVKETKFSPESKKYFTQTSEKTTKKKSITEKSNNSKFTPTKYTQNTVSYFEPSSADTVIINDIPSQTSIAGEAFENLQGSVSTTKFTMSNSSKVILGVAILLLFSGITVMFIGLIRGKSTADVDDNESKENDIIKENDK